MSKDKKKKDPKKVEAGTRSLAVLAARKKVKELSENPEWDLTQEILQEIMATHLIEDPDSTPKVTKLVKELEEEINRRYKYDEEVRKILIDSIPTIPSIRAWVNKDKWKEAVWDKIKNTGLFTEYKRAELINALHSRAVERDTQAAKIWLTISGDYSDKVDLKTDGTLEKFREINAILHSKNKNEED